MAGIYAWEQRPEGPKQVVAVVNPEAGNSTWIPPDTFDQTWKDAGWRLVRLGEPLPEHPHPQISAPTPAPTPGYLDPDDLWGTMTPAPEDLWGTIIPTPEPTPPAPAPAPVTPTLPTPTLPTPTLPGPPAGGVGADVGAEYGPYTQYLRAIGLGTLGYRNAAQQYLESLYNPLQALYGFEQTYSPIFYGAEGVPGEWGNYLTQRIGDTMNIPGRMYGRAKEILSSLMSMPAETRQAKGLTWGARYPEPKAGAPERAVSQNEQQALLAMALRPSWGAYGAQRFAARLPEEENLWQLGRAGGTEGSFLDYLKTKYGLGKFV